MPNEVKAQNTIDLTSLKELSDTVVSTDQYFWHTTNDTGFGAGTHITQKPQDEVLQDPTNAGGNLLATSTGLTLRNGTDMLAEFTKEGVTVDLTKSSLATAGLNFLLNNATASLIAHEDLGNPYLWLKAQGASRSEVALDTSGTNSNASLKVVSEAANSYCSIDLFSDTGTDAFLEFGTNRKLLYTAFGYANSQAQIGVETDTHGGTWIGIGTGGVNYGLYGQQDGEWIIYKDTVGDTRAGENGSINLQTGYDCRNSINACGKVSIQIANINVGTIAANGNKNASVSVTIPTGYIGRAIVGFDMQGTGTASCSLVKLYFNQTDEEVVYWIRNFNNSATGTVTLRAFILCTYDD